MEVENSELTQAYHDYIAITATIRKKNSFQTFYKALALASVFFILIWIGNSFLPSDGFLFSDSILIISCTSICILGFIWYLDLVIVEKTIAKMVVKGLQLEKKYAWIPQFQHTVYKMSQQGYVNLKSTFYIGCFSIIVFALGGLSCYQYMQLDQILNALITSLTSAGIIIILTFLFLILNKIRNPYLELQQDDHLSKDEAEIHTMRFGKSLIFNLYHSLSRYSTQYDAITSSHKGLALAWTLAIISFAITVCLKSPSYAYTYGAIILCLIGTAGVCLIWSLDLNVYHRFWYAVSIQKRTMEEMYPFLPPPKKVDAQNGRLTVNHLYSALNLLILSLATGLSIYLARYAGALRIIALFGVYLSISFLLFFYMHFSSKALKACYLYHIDRSMRNPTLQEIT